MEISKETKTIKIFGPKRLENESFEDYKIRQKMENFVYKYKLKGKYLWVSVDLSNKDWNRVGGTYEYKKHGKLK